MYSLLSSLSWWCPALSVLSYLPNYIFPFICLFVNDEITAFEVIISIFLCFSGDWLNSYPHPPLAVLGRFANILRICDPVLMKYYEDNDINPITYCWPLFESLCSEVLTKNEWLKLWDHLVSDFPNNTLLDSFILAYNVANHYTIMTLNKEELEQFFEKQNPIDINHLIKLMYEINNKYFKADNGSKYIPDVSIFAPNNFNILKYLPLRAGIYPIFDVYPQGIINFQIEERRRIAEEHVIMELKKHQMEDLQAKADRLQNEYNQLKSIEKTIDENETMKLQSMKDDMKKRLKEMEQIDHDLMEKKLSNVLYQEELLKQDNLRRKKQRDTEREMMDKVVNNSKDLNEYYMKKKQEEEAINKSILDASKRVFIIIIILLINRCMTI